MMSAKKKPIPGKENYSSILSNIYNYSINRMVRQILLFRMRLYFILRSTELSISSWCYPNISWSSNDEIFINHGFIGANNQTCYYGMDLETHGGVVLKLCTALEHRSFHLSEE